MPEYQKTPSAATRERETGGGNADSGKKESPAVAMGTEMYKDLTMSCDAVVHLLSRVKDESIKTHMTAALCFYEKNAGKVKKILADHGAEAHGENIMSKTMAHMGIVMNTAMDTSDSHIAQMLIEGSTLSATEAAKLRNEYRGKPDCEELVSIADSIADFESHHIDSLKQFL